MKAFLKILFVFIISVFIFNVFTLHVTAETNRCLYDNAQIIDAVDENKLANIVKEIEYKANISICLVTVRSMTADPQEYANGFYNSYDFSKDGLIILIYNDEITMLSFGRMQTPFYDNKIKQIVEIGETEVANCNYYTAFDKMLNAVSVYVTKVETPNTVVVQEETKDLSWIIPSPASLFISAMATIITACILLWHHNSFNKQIRANIYLSSEQEKSFRIKDRTVIFVGTEHEVIRNYYRSSDRNRR